MAAGRSRCGTLIQRDAGDNKEQRSIRTLNLDNSTTTTTTTHRCEREHRRRRRRTTCRPSIRNLSAVRLWPRGRHDDAGSLDVRPPHVGPVAATLGTVPAPLRLVAQANAVEMKPLDGARVVVAPDHVAVRHLATQAVRRLVGRRRHRHRRRRRRVAALLVRPCLPLLLLLRPVVLLLTRAHRGQCQKRERERENSYNSEIVLIRLDMNLTTVKHDT